MRYSISEFDCCLEQGVKKEAVGPFSPYAELINGRAAMIGESKVLLVKVLR